MKQTLYISILSGIAILALFNWGQSTLLSLSLHQNSSATPLHSLSYQFNGLEHVLKGQPFAGYYTDKDLEAPLAIAQYEQAQFVVAPTVLVINKLDYPFNIIDCTTPQKAIEIMKENNLIPLKSNNGIFLTANPKAGQP